ncbi:MAG: MMPL family transporter [Desulfobacteraceae bacterium]|nr:MMPL family transporter [Desulfobacteraceae bacterium]
MLSLSNVEEFYGEEDTVELRKIIPDGELSTEQIKLTKYRAFENKFVREHLISESGTMTALHVELEKLGEIEKRSAVLAMKKTAEQIASSQFTIYCSGSSLVDVEMNRLSERDFNLFVPAIIVLIMIYIITLELMGWFGIPLDVATTMIASVTIGIAVDDTIHFVSWLRRNSGITNDPAAAIVQTFLDVGKPIVITTFLLFSGFMVLIFGSIIPTRLFGMLTAFSMVFALIGDFFVLPPLVLILKPKLPPLDRQNNVA